MTQMDVAPRSAYVAGVVPADERSVAMGVINIAKSLGAAFGPLITGWLAQQVCVCNIDGVCVCVRVRVCDCGHVKGCVRSGPLLRPPFHQVLFCTPHCCCS